MHRSGSGAAAHSTIAAELVCQSAGAIGMSENHPEAAEPVAAVISYVNTLQQTVRVQGKHRERSPTTTLMTLGRYARLRWR